MCGSSLECQVCHFLPQVIIIGINFLGPKKGVLKDCFQLYIVQSDPDLMYKGQTVKLIIDT